MKNSIKKKEVTFICELVSEGQYFLNETRLHFDEPWAVYVVNGDMYMPYYRIYINDKFVGVARYECEAYKFLLEAKSPLDTMI